MNFTKLLILCILAIAVCSTLAGPAKNRRRNNRGQRGNGNAGGANAGNANANEAENDAENDSEDGTDLKGWKKKAVSGFVYLPLFSFSFIIFTNFCILRSLKNNLNVWLIQNRACLTDHN